MAVAQGSCPNCGAPVEFAVGASLVKVCDYCRHAVVRGDRGLENLGRVADLADTPALIAVGDQGSLAGRLFTVLGRVQLDHGAGPWDEYYVAFDQGQRWGWLAYAQGEWFATELARGLLAPPYGALFPELDLDLAGVSYRVAEVKSGRIESAEGELPGRIRPGQTRYYADCWGRDRRFATLDYDDSQTGSLEVFLGFAFTESDFQVTALGPRSAHKVKTSTLRCPNCGGDVPKLTGDRAERLGCPYCGAISDLALQRVVMAQREARQAPDIPVGQRGTLQGQSYVCTAYVRRSTSFEGEPYAWDEYLLWSQPVGFRWLVKDPETGWSWVDPVNLAELDLHLVPDRVRWGERVLARRNQSAAVVDYVLGEVYWKCEVGETAQVIDFADRRGVLSREASAGEVRWSSSTPVTWPVLAQAFGLALDGAGGRFGGGSGASSSGSSGSGLPPIGVIALIVLLVLVVSVGFGNCRNGGGAGTAFRVIGPWLGSPGVGSYGSGSSSRGSGVFSGGK